MTAALGDVVARLRSRVPMALLPLLVGLRHRLAWSRPVVRRDARAQMEFLLAHTRSDADLESAARAYVGYQVRRAELRWHPSLLTALHVEGYEHLVRARQLGRGVILNFLHHGYYDGAFPSLAGLGTRCHILVHPYMLRADAPRWIQQHIAVASTGGGTLESADIGNDAITGLLHRGRVVAIASDVPGRTSLRFAGREVLGSFGAARLAAQAGCPVVVMTSEEDEQGPVIRLHEALHPADFDSPRALLERMLAVHESVHLRWPEAADLPLSRWGAPAPEAAREAQSTAPDNATSS